VTGARDHTGAETRPPRQRQLLSMGSARRFQARGTLAHPS
jgi:hypothetical protein